MVHVRAKKHLGQHFLKDMNIAGKIAGSLTGTCINVLEVGAGTGVLTRFLLENPSIKLKIIEIDHESIEYLHQTYPSLGDKLQEGDFLKTDLDSVFSGSYALIGNFPYNISSQIFFKVLEHKDTIPEVVGMIQKEVAERIASRPGNKTYGILSVLLQQWYDIEYLFSVSPSVFYPPPRVTSAVIRLRRNGRTEPGCDQHLLNTVVKAAFNQRRKTLHNALKGLADYRGPFANLRAEQLSVEQFLELTREIDALKAS